MRRADPILSIQSSPPYSKLECWQDQASSWDVGQATLSRGGPPGVVGSHPGEKEVSILGSWREMMSCLALVFTGQKTPQPREFSELEEFKQKSQSEFFTRLCPPRKGYLIKTHSLVLEVAAGVGGVGKGQE
uniref:Uncharacterized protein n=1 Tax=Molossus molossus TaxID=27622 RepID=A0A7J8JXP2_MOLMO|nr:hypothetical protein HJG59_007919 [Molossus molossus]